MTVIPMPRAALRDEFYERRDTHTNSPSDTHPDSPGGDVVRRYPTLPDNVYHRAIRVAAARGKFANDLVHNGRPSLTDKGNH